MVAPFVCDVNVIVTVSCAPEDCPEGIETSTVIVAVPPAAILLTVVGGLTVATNVPPPPTEILKLSVTLPVFVSVSV